MAKAVWKGSLGFGLVNIPISLIPGEKQVEGLHFRMLDERDLSPIRYLRVNEKTGEEVPYDDIVRGYEYETDRFVVFTSQDFKQVNSRAAHSIRIEDFVDTDRIEPIFFDRPYYLRPDENGDKGYVLLRDALKRTGKAGIARVVLRNRQHLAAIIPQGEFLLLELLRFPHELREEEQIGSTPPDRSKSHVSEKELDVAEELIEWMSDDWQPDKYRDTYYEDLKRLIDRKVEAGETYADEMERPEPIPLATNRTDFLPLLEQSLERAGTAKGRHGETGGRRRRRRAPERPTQSRT